MVMDFVQILLRSGGRAWRLVSKVRVTRWARNSQDERAPVRVHPRAPPTRLTHCASCLRQPSAGLTDVTGIWFLADLEWRAMYQCDPVSFSPYILLFTHFKLYCGIKSVPTP